MDVTSLDKLNKIMVTRDKNRIKNHGAEIKGWNENGMEWDMRYDGEYGKALGE